MFSQSLPVNYQYIANNPLTNYRPCPALTSSPSPAPLSPQFLSRLRAIRRESPSVLAKSAEVIRSVLAKRESTACTPRVKPQQGLWFHLLTLSPTYTMLCLFFDGCENASQYFDEIFYPAGQVCFGPTFCVIVVRMEHQAVIVSSRVPRMVFFKGKYMMKFLLCTI
jgi:hypothetical protein